MYDFFHLVLVLVIGDGNYTGMVIEWLVIDACKQHVLNLDFVRHLWICSDNKWSVGIHTYYLSYSNKYN